MRCNCFWSSVAVLPRIQAKPDLSAKRIPTIAIASDVRWTPNTISYICVLYISKAYTGRNMTGPLANSIRPKNLDEFAGQEHLVGSGKPLREAMDGRHLFSFILWGPPGSGKTTLARIYASALDADFYELSAVDSGKDDIKNILGF